MITTQQNIEEAKRATTAYIASQRRARLGTPGAVFTSEDEPDYVELAREQAKRFCEAKAEKRHPVRPIDESDRSAVEGQKAALSFLEKKKRSAIRK
jgi:hypothetical protein